MTIQTPAILSTINPSWDLFIIVSFTLITILAVMVGRSKTLNILVASFAGYVVATELGNFAFDTASRYASGNSNISLFSVRAVLFFLTVIVLYAKTEVIGKNDQGSLVINAAYGILACGFLTTALLSFLNSSQKASILSNSNIITQIDTFKIFWIIGPIIFLIFADVIHSKVAKKD